MRTLLLTFSLIFTVSLVQANQDAKPQFKTIDINHLMKKPEPLKEEKKASMFSMSCTDASGKVIKKGEPGYKSCMNNAAHNAVRGAQGKK